MDIETRMQKTGRNPDKMLKEIRRACDEKGYKVEERQNGGSHRVVVIYGERTVGTVVTQHGEIPKGTFRSILKALVAAGLIIPFIVIIITSM